MPATPERAQAPPPPSRPVRFFWSRLPAGVRGSIKRLLRRDTDSPAPPPVCQDFWTCTYTALAD